MPIRVFPPHYQLVYINFDISSFSLISYEEKEPHLQAERAPFTTPFGPDCIHNKMAKPPLGSWGAKKGEHVCTPLAMQRYY